MKQEQQKTATKANLSKPLRFSRRIAVRKRGALTCPSPSANRGTAPDFEGLVSRPGKRRDPLARTARPAKSSSRPIRKRPRPATKRPLQRRTGERASVSITFTRLSYRSQRFRVPRFILGSKGWKRSHLNIFPKRERQTLGAAWTAWIQPRPRRLQMEMNLP